MDSKPLRVREKVSIYDLTRVSLLVAGNNLVDAAIESKVQVLVYSALDDIKSATGGKFKVPHFTGTTCLQPKCSVSSA